jgi:hypothetical protein
MDHVTRNLSIQTFSAKLLLNDLERGTLRRELATPFISVERRNAIHEEIATLFRQYKLTKSKLQWVQAEMLLNRPTSQIAGNNVRQVSSSK